MYKIEKRKTGYFMKFSGDFTKQEAEQWYEELQQVFEKEKSAFWLIADMRGLRPLGDEAKEILMKGIKQYKQLHTNQRSAVVMDNSAALAQMRNIGVTTGVAVSERYFNSAKDPKAIDKAIDWVKHGIDYEQP